MHPRRLLLTPGSRRDERNRAATMARVANSRRDVHSDGPASDFDDGYSAMSDDDMPLVAR